MESLNPTITSKLSFHKPLFVKPSLSHRNISKSIFFSHSKRPFSFTTTCKLKSPQDNRKSQTSISKKILLSEGAPPPLAEEGGNEEAVVGSSGNDRSGGGVMGMVKRLPRKVLAILSNLPLAIGEMFTVAALMALGTIIDQGEAPDFYFQKYPEENPFLGFFTWRWVLTLGFDHVYSSPIFLGTLALLGTSLMACTYTTQIPLVKVARRWNFLHSAEAILKQEFSDTLPRASVQDLGVILMGSGYETSSVWFLSLPPIHKNLVLKVQVTSLCSAVWPPGASSTITSAPAPSSSSTAKRRTCSWGFLQTWPNRHFSSHWKHKPHSLLCISASKIYCLKPSLHRMGGSGTLVLSPFGPALSPVGLCLRNRPTWARSMNGTNDGKCIRISNGNRTQVFLKGPSLYAFKGLAGRFAPIGVHLAMLLIMAGGTLSATGSFRGSVTVPQGLNFVVGDVLGPTGFLSAPTEAFNTEVHVNRFYMDYYDSGEVSQFHTDLSLYDLNGKEVLRKTISVNDPLRYGGITIYQTDWSFSALQILKDNEGPFNLAMAPLKINGDKKLFGTFLPIGDVNSPNVKGISMLARDLQSIVLYDQEGKFVGIRRPNSKLPIEINGTNIVIEDAIGSSGLDLKTDPGVPIVYAGFGALMLTTCISYLSHAQIWAFQDGTAVVVGAKTNRAKAEFPDEMNRLLDQLPEIVESSSSK
ncbi:hypothetical protein L484_026960 [Morus notabilis]|uniref:ResB-like domain-containing protein n=1 Tax=Morus notabilis TaxID=981085 RepID=W9RBN1_9ROSA|nr:hypothetical protein L484_026960 [Morus notabilis]